LFTATPKISCIGLVHFNYAYLNRDLKPENLLLDSNKPNANLKVIDFGTSRRFVEGKKMTQKFGTVRKVINGIITL